MDRCPCCNARLAEAVFCPRCQADLSSVLGSEHMARYWLNYALQFWVKVANIALIPALLVLLGIGLTIYRRRR